MSEEWRPIPGYEGRYEVSDQGRVRITSSSHVMAQQVRRYLQVGLTTQGRKKLFNTHRLVLAAFVGPCPAGMVTRHLNGDPTDNRLENLRYGTQRENILDAVGHGTHRHARLTHCPCGHPYAGENLRIDSTGGRRCRTCERARNRRAYKQMRIRQKSAA